MRPQSILLATMATAIFLAAAFAQGSKPNGVFENACSSTRVGTYRWKSAKIDPRPVPAASQITKATVKQMSDDITKFPPLSIGPTDITAPRAPNTPEERFYRLEAWVQRVKFSADDGDIHLEVSDTDDATAQRAIIEVPPGQTFCDVRQAVFDALGLEGSVVRFPVTAGLTTWDRGFATASSNQYGKRVPLPKPWRVTAVGLGFWDGAHASNTSNHGSQFVKSIWEIHPVRQITATVN